MLRFLTRSNPAIDSDRREWLRIGGLAGLAWASRNLLPPPAQAASSPASRSPGFGKARSVILVFASGGQSQLDTWDPKPGAPAEIRGAFDSVATAVPGVRFCEHMPRIAQIADGLTVVRSMSHEDLDYGSAVYLSLTGRYHRQRSGNPLPAPDDAPCHGAILHRARPSTRFVHTAVHLNGPALVPTLESPGQFGGFLGKRYDPFTLGDVSQDHVAVPGLEPLRGLPPVRHASRKSLLASLEGYRRGLESNRAVIDSSALYQQAFEMLSRPATREAFRLSAESQTIRNRYGRNRSAQACLLSRRLVEAGVPLVTVFFNHSNRGQDTHPEDADAWGWDTHNDIFYGLKEQLLPRFDQAISALIEDLDQRGLLEETLVVCLGEFGRAPLVALEPRFAGATPGRKHWASVYSIALAGAGVSRGTVLGASDDRGAYPASERYGPWDAMATIFSALGIDPHSEYTNDLGQPFRICEGRVIEGLYAG